MVIWVKNVIIFISKSKVANMTIHGTRTFPNLHLKIKYVSTKNPYRDGLADGGEDVEENVCE